MSASLVGSEMCIRDRPLPLALVSCWRGDPTVISRRGPAGESFTAVLRCAASFRRRSQTWGVRSR
eukprot:14330379-Alexandrium_andersonii.AAC.1